MDSSTGWKVDKDDDELVTYKLDERHILYIRRLKKGISIKVYDEKESNRKPKIMFRTTISNRQLGHVSVKKVK